MSRFWMPFYVADYLADTGHLSAAESGAYMHLIFHYWINGSLPDDDRRLARIARMDREEWEEARETIAAFFQPGWRHSRVEEELAKQQDKSDMAKAKAEKRWHGKAGADAKVDAAAYADADATAMPGHMPKPCKPKPQSQSQLQSKIIGEARKRAARLPADWVLPDDYREAARQRGLSDAEITRQADRMRNWSLSATGGAKLDWFRTWLNWIDSAPKNVTPLPARDPAFAFSKPAANF